MPQAEYHRHCDLLTAANHAFTDPEDTTHGSLDDAVRGAAAVLRGCLTAYYTPPKAEQLLREVLAALPRLHHDGDRACDHPASAMGRVLHEALRDDQAPARWGF